MLLDGACCRVVFVATSQLKEWSVVESREDKDKHASVSCHTQHRSSVVTVNKLDRLASKSYVRPANLTSKLLVLQAAQDDGLLNRWTYMTLKHIPPSVA